MEWLNFGTASPSSPGNSHDHHYLSPLERYTKYEHHTTTNDTLASNFKIITKRKKKGSEANREHAAVNQTNIENAGCASN